MPSLYTTKEQIQKQIETDLKANGLFKAHNFNSPLSKINTILRTFSNSILLFVDNHLTDLYKAIHPHSANESDLHAWLKRYGMNWKEAIKATHKLYIGSITPVTQNVQIPQGLIVFTPGEEYEQIKFQIMNTNVLTPSTPIDSEGRYTVEVLCECVDTGVVGNVIANSITEIESPPSGIDVCYNPDNTPQVAGEERETIQSVRSRIFNYENSLGSMWTPAWFVSQAENYAFVKRAIFVTSKTLNKPGTVKLLLIGSGYLPVSDENLTLIADDLNGEDKNPGGAYTALLENAELQIINRDIIVYFADVDSILLSADLQEVYETYFRTLNAGSSFKEADLKFAFYALPKVIQVSITPSGDEAIPESTIAVPGVFNITGEVYS